MSGETPRHLSSLQGVMLIALRTLIGWHFLYEGYYKLALPAWSPAGTPLAPWSSAGYLKSAWGPLAGLFQRMLDAGWTPWIDGAVKIGLLLIGLSLMLGLFTKLGCWAALLLLTFFYVLAIPTTGTPQPGNEGTYLIINKTLIEAAAVGVLLAFNTGAIAGLDLLLTNGKRRVLRSSGDVALQTPARSLVERRESGVKLRGCHESPAGAKFNSPAPSRWVKVRNDEQALKGRHNSITSVTMSPSQGLQITRHGSWGGAPRY